MWAVNSMTFFLAYTKKQENMTYSKAQSNLIQIIPGDTQTLALLDQYFYKTVLKMLKKINKTMDKGKKIMYQQNEISIKR